MSNFIFYDNLEDYEEQVRKAKAYDKQVKEIKRLHSIIKEVREEIRILETNCDIADYQAQKLFNILDRVGDSNE